MFKRIYIELSNYCNLNCTFCTPKDKNNRILTLDQYKFILNQVKKHTKEVCLHVLGEPTIHPDFIEILKYTNENNINIMLSTNGIKIPSMTENLLNTYIKTFNISLHSSYMLSKIKQEEYLKDILNFITLYQNKYESVFHLRLWADDNSFIKKSNDNIKSYLFNYYNYNDKIAKRIRLKDRIILSYEEEFEWPNINSNTYSDGYCLGGKNHIAILADGTVVLCCLDSSGHTNLGNIFHDDLNDILKSEKYLTTIKSFQDNKCSLELCKHCTYKRSC